MAQAHAYMTSGHSIARSGEVDALRCFAMLGVIALHTHILPMGWIGVWLFYVQHQFEDTYWSPSNEWDFAAAAIHGSSFYRLPKVLQWFTGNIGYHHIHHLNVRIPFYRLPEAMAAIPALQSPVTTSLAPREIVNCFRASLWDEGWQRMVSYSEAKQAA